jgi:hypothetical protein
MNMRKVLKSIMILTVVAMMLAACAPAATPAPAAFDGDNEGQVTTSEGIALDSPLQPATASDALFATITI